MKGYVEIMKEMAEIADRECYCKLKGAESDPYPDCDNCEIHKASFVLNEIGGLISGWERSHKGFTRGRV